MRCRWWVAASLCVLVACSPAAPRPLASHLYVFRSEPPALIEVNADLSAGREIPVVVPDGCSMGVVVPAPQGPMLALELNCPFGPAVLWLNTDSGEMRQPVTTSDSHLLAWSPDGRSAYLRVNSINRPKVILQAISGEQRDVAMSELTYDVAPSHDGSAVLFSFSRGMGLGSEMWKAKPDGTGARRLLVDGQSYLALARWSPDGTEIALIKIPDSAVPFTVGELWVMSSDGRNARKLAEADAGHGFAPAWSPDGGRIAFVARENPGDASADASAAALESNLYIVETSTGSVQKLTEWRGARVESPNWKPDAEEIAFAGVVDDRMAVFLANSTTGEIRRVMIEGVCCAAWVRN